MFVGDKMSKPVISISPDMPISDALVLMKKEKIRRAPVVKDGKLVGIVSDKDLLNASPSPVTTLSIWEMNYLLSKVTISEVMSQNVLTVTEDTPIEQAARIMADNKIGGLPVMKDGHCVGIITETDLFKVFLELLGAREAGVRATIVIEDRPGSLAAITKAVADKKASFISLGQTHGEKSGTHNVTFKVEGITLPELRELLTPIAKEILDLRS
jgi:acetoin utilization protein AcuB